MIDGTDSTRAFVFHARRSYYHITNVGATRRATRHVFALRSRRRGAGRSDRHGHERAGARGSDRTRRGAIAKHAADTAKGGTQRTAARKRGGHYVRVSEHGASAHTGRAARPVAREGLCGGIARSRRLYRNPRFSNGLSNHKSSCFQLADPDVRTARSGAVPSSIGTPDLSSARSRVAILERCRTSSRPLRRTRSRAHSKTRMKNASQRRCAPRLVPDRRFSDWCVSPLPPPSRSPRPAPLVPPRPPR